MGQADREVCRLVTGSIWNEEAELFWGCCDRFGFCVELGV